MNNNNNILSGEYQIIRLKDAAYPALLKEIQDPPAILYALGNLDLLQTPQIAMVGTRKPTINGRETAKQFAAYLAKAGFTITSGLALGIDGASHEGALQAGGNTIAVLGNGFDHIYPKTHQQLYANIARHGLLLSEFEPSVGPRAENFPKRNRIISGLSLATLVVEAAVKSGSLITAHLASDQGREVFAIPGSIHNPQARGCHALIKNGAKLIETVDDVLIELRALLQFQLDLPPLPATDEKLLVSRLDKKLSNMLKYVDYVPTSINHIIEHSGESHDTIFAALIQLELAGYVISTAAGYTRVAQ
ncbi:MAG: DNA-processing protein DprA [Gammaproteobacteria bacterium]